jgi:hypothetical protein
MENILNDVRQLFERGIYKNEQHIRFCVVCRILQELGWNIWNPEEVNLEFACAPEEDSTKVDVALRCTPLKPDVFLETKSYGQIRNTLDKPERQLRDYNRNNTAMFSIITDGAEWRFYYSQTGGEFAQKCFKILNLLREPVQDVQASFKTLLQKTEVQNGNAEKEAIAYLRLTQKQRLMEDLLPEARRKALETPFPALPQALVHLLTEQGVEVSMDEAATFISEFQERRPSLPPPPPATLPQPSSLGSIRKEAGLKNPMSRGGHQLDPRNPGDLRFTKIIEGRIGFEEATGWIDLVKARLRIALSKGISFSELARKLSVNMKAERYDQEGFIWHSDINLSIQGFDSKKAADNLYRLARLMNEELYIRLYWRDKEEAAHPGEEGVIHWRP